MGNWRIIGEGRGFDGDDSMDHELEKAYKEGCREGYRKAMEEMNGNGGGYGERNNYNNSNPYSNGPSMNYGERDGGYSDGGYGERQGVKGTGPYSRYRYRRY